jgi:sugar/nucleoside kinase (ribokinase family)
MTEKTLDAVLCGSCVLDILVRPVPLDRPVGADSLVRVEPIRLCPGGFVSNAGIAMARLGMRVAGLTYVGDDEWGPILRGRYSEVGVDTRWLKTLPGVNSSTTVVLIDEQGRRSFVHCVGAPKRIDKSLLLEHLDVFAQSRAMLIGYYPLLPNLLGDLAEVLAEIRATGCLTAMDSAGGGGTMQPLDNVLPHLDVYIPSFQEASQQTGQENPAEIIRVYRECGAPGLLGVKLGARGAVLSPTAGESIEIPPVDPPGQVVDTTGAGDTFYAGLMAGMLKGLSPYDAGRLAAATGACCVTAVGGTAAIRNWEETARLAGITGTRAAEDGHEELGLAAIDKPFPVKRGPANRKDSPCDDE